MEPLKPNLLRPVLIGAAVGVVVTSIPPLCCLNLCCCFNFVLAGAVAGAVYGRGAARMGWYAGIGEGALTGLLAGLLTGLIHGLLGALLLSVTGGLVLFQKSLGGALAAANDWELPLPPGRVVPALFQAMIHLIASIALGPLAGALGGMLGLFLSRPDAGAPGSLPRSMPPGPAAPPPWSAPAGPPPFRGPTG